MRSIFFAPHSDDECLFGAFTLLKYQPTVVICFPSSGDYGDTKERFNESVAACMNLGVSDVRQWMGGDLIEQMQDIRAELDPGTVWVPAPAAAHPEHNAVREWALNVFSPESTYWYNTYVLDVHGQPKKQTEIIRVKAVNGHVGYRWPNVVDDPKWIAIKHFALTKYQTQIAHPRARVFFQMDLHEYAEQP